MDQTRCPYCRTASIGPDGKCSDAACAAQPGPTAGDVAKALGMLKREMESPAFARAVRDMDNPNDDGTETEAQREKRVEGRR